MFVNAETDFVEERFAPGSTLWLAPGRGRRSLTVASLRVQGGRPVLSFEGLTRIEDVEGLAGCELRVPESMLAPLDEGRFYHHQLVGCVVETTAGIPVGVVIRIDGGAGGSLLAVAGARGEILVPLAADICVAVDIAAKRIRIEPPAGLLELNEKPEAGRAAPAPRERSQ